MTDITKIKVSVSRLVAGPKPLIGLLKYENVDYSCEVEASVDTNENAHEVYDKLLNFCKTKIQRELDRIEGINEPLPIEEDYVPNFEVQK